MEQKNLVNNLTFADDIGLLENDSTQAQRRVWMH